MKTSGAIKSKNVDYSHFISLPLSLEPGTDTKLKNFQKSVLQTYKDLGIDEFMFIKPQTFHLTVLMLKLWNNERTEAAAKVLRGVSQKVNDELEGRPVSIRLNGLDSMSSPPERAYVVAASVVENGAKARLENACHMIINAFLEAGLATEEDAKKFKLHVTLMNAKYSKSKTKSGKTEPFDARRIFSRYGKEEWGKCRISEVHISQRFKYHSRSGYFHRCAFITFPKENQGVIGTKKNFFQKIFSC